MLSLCIRGSDILVLQGQAGRDGVRADGFFAVPLGFPVRDDPGAAGQALRAALDSRGIIETSAVFTVRSADVFFRKLTLPASRPAQLRDMVGHQLAAGVPRLQDFRVDYVILTEHADRDRKLIEALACGIPKTLADVCHAVALAAGLRPERLDVQQSAFRALLAGGTIGGEPLADASVLFLDSGSDLLFADLVVNGKSVFSRVTPIAGEPGRDGEPGFADFALPGGLPGEKRTREQILGEMQRLMQFALSRNIKAPASRCYLYGEKSGDGELAEYLREVAGVPVEQVSSAAGIASGTDDGQFGERLMLAAALLPAAGRRMNFFADYEEQSRRQKQKGIMPVLFGSAVACLAIVVLLWNFFSIQNRMTAGRIAQYSETVGGQSHDESGGMTVADILEARRLHSESCAVNTGLLNQIFESQPDDLVVNSVSCEGGRLTLDCHSARELCGADFTAILRENPAFSEIIYAGVSSDGSGFAFSITVTPSGIGGGGA